jgi:phage-related protein
MRNTRPIVWLKANRRDFEDFPDQVRDRLLDALTVVAEGGMPPIAKPLAGFGSGVLELALAFRGDAFRVVFALTSALMCGWSTPSRRSRRPG